MIDMRYKPIHLPQVSAPFNIVLDGLNEMGVKYIEMDDVDPQTLTPSQGFTFCDDFDDTTDKPIWIAGEDDDKNTVIDGHHRWVNALSLEKPVKAVKIMSNFKDACRILNKIQDLYEYKEHSNVEEVVAQNVLNDVNSTKDEIGAWLGELELVNEEDGDQTQNQQSIVAYRNKPINETSVIGNFFTLIPGDGYDKYEVDFDNLLDTNDLNIQILDGQNPIDVLAKIWFPNLDFDKICSKFGVTSENLKSRCIAEKAKQMKYDGIKYGNNLIQGFN